MNEPLIQTRRSAASAMACGLAVLSLLGVFSAKAVHIQTPSELRRAIETSPGNVLVLDHSIKISSGLAQPPGAEVIATGGAILLGPGVAFELEGVSLNFAGPLLVQGAAGGKAEIKMSRSQLNARSITFALPGAGSSIGSSLSSLRATAGDFAIHFGSEGALEFKEQLLPGPGYGLSASGAISISGGSKLNLALDETVVDTVNGFSFSANRSDVSVKVDKVLFRASAGSVSFHTVGSTLAMKATVEILESTFRVRDFAELRLEGGESTLNLKQTSFGPFNELATAAGVRIETGVRGALSVSEISAFDVLNVSIRASHQGVLLVEKSLLSSEGDLAITTGNQGVTVVKENLIASGTRVRITTGAFGVCETENNAISAPIQEFCP